MLLIINVRAGYCGGIAGRGYLMLARGGGGWIRPASEAGKAGEEADPPRLFAQETRPPIMNPAEKFSPIL